ncbi:MAG TPA: mechanosensitive ion channel domain-containing protein [Ginsengibacter sp.]
MKFLDQVYLDNSVRSYLIVFITILIAFVLKRIISKYAAALLFKLVKKNAGKLDKLRFNSLIITPIETLLFVLISLFAIDRLNFPQDFMFTIHKVTTQDIVEGIASAIIIISFISLIIRFMDFLVLLIKSKALSGNTPGEHQLLFFFKDLIRVIIIIIGFVFILKISFGLNIGNLFTGLSIVGAALALSARESLENLIASFIIFFDKPFEAGDVVKVNNFSGTVERIGLRSTRLRTIEKSMVTVPNKQMVDSILDNWSMRDVVRNEIKTYLSSHTSSEDLETVIAGIKEILLGNKEKIQTYSVYLQEINNDNAIIMIIYFTKFGKALSDVNQLRQDINIGIRKLHEKHEIKPAAPTAVKIVE